MKNGGLPEALLISGHSYSVALTHEEMDGKMGHVRHDKQAIRIHPDQHPDALRDTLLHEAIHAIDYNGQLEMTERQVHVLATAVCDVLWTNPKFANWLLAK